MRHSGIFAPRRWIPTLAGLIALAALTVLYRLDWPAYIAAFRQLGVSAFYYPFLDFEAMLGGAQCWQHGIDVYSNNPCDILQRPHDYSPLWLRLGFLPGLAWGTASGWAFAIGFYLSLGILAPARSRWALALMVVAGLSPPVAFALERANVDALMFILMAAGGGLLLLPTMFRLGGYTLLLTAGLLKFYPVVTLVLAFRERPKIFSVVAIVSGVILGAFVVYFHHELALLPRNIPTGSFFADFIAAVNLPKGIAFVLRREHWPMAEPAEMAAWAILLAATFVTVLRVTRWPQLTADLAGLSPAERVFLLMGAATLVGCFFVGQNIGYRGIHLIFAVPGLTALAILSSDRSVRRFALWNCIILGVLIWDGPLTWRPHIPVTTFGLGVAAVAWVVRELMWWRLIAVFLGLIVCFILEIGRPRRCDATPPPDRAIGNASPGGTNGAVRNEAGVFRLARRPPPRCNATPADGSCRWQAWQCWRRSRWSACGRFLSITRCSIFSASTPFYTHSWISKDRWRTPSAGGMVTTFMLSILAISFSAPMTARRSGCASVSCPARNGPQRSERRWRSDFSCLWRRCLSRAAALR